MRWAGESRRDSFAKLIKLVNKTAVLLKWEVTVPFALRPSRLVTAFGRTPSNSCLDPLRVLTSVVLVRPCLVTLCCICLITRSKVPAILFSLLWWATARSRKLGELLWFMVLFVVSRLLCSCSSGPTSRCLSIRTAVRAIKSETTSIRFVTEMVQCSSL